MSSGRGGLRTTVKRDGDRIWLEGVTGWHPIRQSSSIHAAQAAIMAALGEEVSYEYLLGVSALAFRMQVGQDLCPSSTHAFCGHK